MEQWIGSVPGPEINTRPNIKDCASGGDRCGQGTDIHEKDFKKYSLRVIITYNDFVNNLTALKCVFLQVKE